MNKGSPSCRAWRGAVGEEDVINFGGREKKTWCSSKYRNLSLAARGADTDSTGRSRQKGPRHRGTQARKHQKEEEINNSEVPFVVQW